MKNLNRYIQEKYLINNDTHIIDLDDCYDNREPDFMLTSANVLSKVNLDISKNLINFIKKFTTSELYAWKYEYSTNSEYDAYASASQLRRLKRGYKRDITTYCDVYRNNDNNVEVIVLVDKKNPKIVPEIWVTVNKYKNKKYGLYIEPQNEGA